MVRIVLFLHTLACLTTVNIVRAVKQSPCEDGYNLNYTLPMFEVCSEREHPEMGMLRTIPKLIPTLSPAACSQRNQKNAIQPGKRVCRFSDCLNEPCKNGWCEDSMTGFVCQCIAGFTGQRCETQSTITQNTPTMPTTEPTTSHLTTTTQSTITQDTTTMSTTRDTTTMSTTRDTTTMSTTRDTTTMSTTRDTTTMSTTRDTTTMSTTQDTTTMSTTRDTTTMSTTESTTLQSTTTMLDEILPDVLSCPLDKTFTAPVGTTTHSFTWTPPTATDPAVIQSIVSNHQPGVEVSVGNPITVTYTVTYNNGLPNTECSFSLSVLPADSKWKCSSSKCYYLAEDERSWQEAKNLCTNLDFVTTETGQKDPSLLFNDNDPDFEKIETLFSLSTKVWINCNDKSSEGTLICDVDGTGSPHTQENWNSDEPSGGDQHDCVAVGLRSEKWENSRCDENYHTVCQVLL